MKSRRPLPVSVLWFTEVESSIGEAAQQRLFASSVATKGFLRLTTTACCGENGGCLLDSGSNVNSQWEITDGSQGVFRASCGMVGRGVRGNARLRRSAILAAEEKPKGNPLLAVAKGKDYEALVSRS